MFCFQCQQTAKNIACTTSGVCGKDGHIANLQDLLLSKTICLAAANKKNTNKEITKLIIDALFVTVTNVNFQEKSIKGYIETIEKTLNSLNVQSNFDIKTIWEDSNEDLKSLKSLIIFAIKGIAAYAKHANNLNYQNDGINNFFNDALDSIINENNIDNLLALTLKAGEVNLKCMELLDKANTECYGHPEPTEVSLNIEKGPFIIITGHDLKDLHMLLEQTKDKGINIYTHGEMLPCHAYPKLKTYKHLKGNFGTAWQNQQNEFSEVPAPILFTTNCIMPVRNSYKDRVFTTSVVAYEKIQHIGNDKDFSPIIKKALELGGYKNNKAMHGINGGTSVNTGFAHNAVLSNASVIVDSVKKGAIKHFFLVGGCDGAAVGRNYYTDFVKQSPADSIILTLACGKFRFNDLDLGKIGPFPRILDVGQCNDAFGAIKIAVALAEAFKCGINELPLSFILSWYEQKAVCILLTLLALGIKNIYLGPSLPAFISNNVLNILVEKWNIQPITTAKKDLAKILEQ